ncbi:hypothetical protein [Jeongeupia sp. USM3]|uniref:hypothetical protein n=1 Tax=Jeongeupia sp. USM3 TaxID=1906741 RepID=UPI00089E02CA|nr:hypothetical protein [Jeongeupia sp. USM3]AOY01404.1 hypothetical protein BJP62_13665 [Jeongeupia sp. USM3]
MSDPRLKGREARKQLLQLEAETHRLQIAVCLTEIRAPLAKGQRGLLWLSVFKKLQGNAGVLMLASRLFSKKYRVRGIAQMIPVALGAWKVALLVRRLFKRS